MLRWARIRDAKVFTWQTVPPRARGDESAQAAKVAGFSLPAGAVAEPHRRDKRERLCGYSSQPAVSEKRLALTSSAKIRYPLKTPYREGTTQVMFEPFGCHRQAGRPATQPPR